MNMVYFNAVICNLEDIWNNARHLLNTDTLLLCTVLLIQLAIPAESPHVLS